MIGMGYGSHTSPTSSSRPVGTTGSRSRSITSRMYGRKRSAALGVNAGATIRRSRPCSSPSVVRIDGRRCAKKSAFSGPASSASFAANWWKRRSRRIATESS